MTMTATGLMISLRSTRDGHAHRHASQPNRCVLHTASRARLRTVSTSAAAVWAATVARPTTVPQRQAASAENVPSSSTSTTWCKKKMASQTANTSAVSSHQRLFILQLHPRKEMLHLRSFLASAILLRNTLDAQFSLS